MAVEIALSVAVYFKMCLGKRVIALNLIAWPLEIFGFLCFFL